MPVSEPFPLKDYSALLADGGASAVIARGAGPPPSGDGLNVGWAEMERPPPHGGECHPEGDEMLILLAGDISILLEEATTRTVRLRPGEAFIVPQGVWHRLLVHSPARLIYLNRGRSEHRPLPDSATASR